MGVQSAQQLSPQQPQAPTNASQSVVQRASDNKDHHQQFLKQRVSTAGVNPLNNPHYLLAEACAYILDHNSYEAKHMNLPPQYHAIAAFVPNSGNAQDYLKIVHDYIQNALKQKTSTME